MRYKKSMYFSTALFYLMSTIAMSLVPNYSSVNAAGRYDVVGKGYFGGASYPGEGSFSGGFTTYVIRGGPTSYIGGLSYGLVGGSWNKSRLESKSQFISFIEARLNGVKRSSDDNFAVQNNKVGAAYIIQLMRGGNDRTRVHTAGASTKNAILQDWRSRINSSDIKLEYTTSYRFTSNTAAWVDWSYSTKDAFRYNKTSTEPALLFKSVSTGNTLFAIKLSCANPLGGLPGLSSDNYNLTPDITGTPSVTEQPTEVTLNPAVGNSGTTAASGIRWQITDFGVAPGAALPVAGTGGASPESYYGNSFIAKEEGTTNFRVGIHNFNQRTRDIGQYPVGTRVCFGLSVRPHTHTSGSVWKHSAPFCVVIAKTPKAQVRGGDLISINGNIRGSVSSRDISGVNRLFGSWGEYGVFAGGAVTGVASAAGYARGSISNSFCDVSLLTFTNATNNSCNDTHEKGNYTGITNNVSSIKARFSGGSAISSGTVNISSTAKGQYESTRNTLTITNSSAAIPKGKHVIISAPNAVVTIHNNIRYTGERLASAGEIPQVVIIARQINIRGSVTQLDAWLVADTINTCSDVGVTSPLSTAQCNQQLVVNGPVIADTIHLRRTHGAENNSPGVAAEVFNLRPDAYLWATHLTTSSGRLQSTASKELPPRF